MAEVWAISTNKGGVLKTSITTNLAGVLSEKGKRVLIVDTDNQGNAALSFGVNPDPFEVTLYDVLTDEKEDPQEAIIKVAEGIDLLPSNDDMAFFEFDVLTNGKKFPQPFHLLRERLASQEDRYDYILIDSPPNMGLTQGNVLSYAKHVLIPFQPENYSMRSLVKILKAIRSFKEQHNPELSVLGVVATLVDSRTSLHSAILQECRKYCMQHEIRMLETVIPKSIRFASAVAYEGVPATLSSDRNNVVVKAYQELFEEVVTHG